MNDDTLQHILADIDLANSADPNQETWAGASHPKELLYSHRMSAWLSELRPDADAALQVAARAQHICRWEHPRDSYPMDRKGYLTWRRELYTFHAEKVGAIMQKLGVDGATIKRVSFLLHKKKLHDDPDSQALEDAACLVFLEFHIDALAAKTDREKRVGIIRKTWRKMSEAAHAFAQDLTYSEDTEKLLGEALNGN
ncbi:MAG: DUF4202 domain-containing protein [Candidatus Hydrogenedentes bacterium]|nr:DUF4202 domain-containing protein [Candidatus Hydrogenedentota bacterium]